MKKFKLATVIILALAIGFVLGAAAIQRPIPDAPLELPPARKPWSPKDVMGLIGSIGTRALAGHLETLPLVVLETDKTFALKIPDSKTEVHYVLVPKKDIPDPGRISAEDAPYLADIFLTARKLIEEKGLSDYQIYTNGPGFQSVGYLHFHLIDKKRRN